MLISSLFTPALAQSPDGVKPWPTDPKERTLAVKSLLKGYGEEYGLKPSKIALAERIMLCENKDLDPTLQSRIIDSRGIREESYGLVQIHLPSHPEISLEQATDPYFSIEYIVKELKAGHEKQWSCYRIIQGLDGS